MLRHWDYGASLVVLGLLLASGTLFAVASGTSTDGVVRAEIGRVALIQRESSEESSLARNKRLNELFRDYVDLHGGKSTALLIRQFNDLLTKHRLSNFDDFLAAMTRPVRYVLDSATGDRVPVFGALGSDVINPWLAAAGIVEGKPLDQQPMYHSAIRALRENLDFAAIGVEDPNLSLDLLPPELHDNARSAYARLNPTNRFQGGFDHPLFYCVVREAAEKFFRQDHPQAKLTMADLVVPVAQGGFGIDSCLLCHERDHSGVYRRLLGQGKYLTAKANELLAVSEQGHAGGEDPAKLQEDASVFLRAAECVLKAFPDRIDAVAVEQSLLAQSSGNYERLKPGYEDFVAALGRAECLQCHGAQTDINDELNPACYGAFVLDTNAYNKNANVRALCELIDFEDVALSRLLAKASNRLAHEGAARVKLDEAQTEVLSQALTKWIQSFPGSRDGRESAPPALGDVVSHGAETGTEPRAAGPPRNPIEPPPTTGAIRDSLSTVPVGNAQQSPVPAAR